MRLNGRRGFTLIELLVVIAIIGLLASVIIASVDSARMKGLYAHNQQLDSGAYHQLGDSLAGSWQFKDCSGSTTADSSGYNNNGSIVGTALWSSDNPFGSGCSLQLNGSSYVNIPGYSSLSPNSSDFSISVWIKTSAAGDIVQASDCNAGCFSHGYALVIPSGWGCSAGQIYFSMTDGGSIDPALCSNSSVIDGKWHFVVLTVNRTSRIKTLYIDGGMSNSNSITISGSIVLPSFQVGKASWNSYFSGLVSNLRVYQEAIASRDVERMYTQDSPRFNIAAK